MDGKKPTRVNKRKAAARAANEAKRRKHEKEMDPCVQIERKVIDLEALDLQNKQHVDAWKEPELPQRPPRQERWQYKGDDILMDRKKFPKGWNSDEPDLDPLDVDAQIVRCKERIEDNYAPWIFENRLKELEEKKKMNEMTKEGEPADLPWLSYVRINALKNIGASRWDPRDNKKDPENQLPNIKALLEEYRTGKLIWRHGLVTYWSNGKRLCEPRPFDWDELEAISRHIHKESTGFWVEGICGPGPIRILATNLVIPMNPIASTSARLYNYRIAMRVPNFDWHEDFEFLFDTGASTMLINMADIRALRGPLGVAPILPPVPVLGALPWTSANGVVTISDVCEFECCILDSNRYRLTAWHRIHACVRPANCPGDRLDGPFGRSMLFSAFKPDNSYDLTMSATKNGLNLLPLNLTANPPVIDNIVLGVGGATSAPVAEMPAGLAFKIPLPPAAGAAVPP